jgi:hypothetical protein
MTQRQQSGFLKDIVGAYIPKDPNASLQYGVDWTDWLDAGDSIVSASWAVETTSTNAIEASLPNILANVTSTTLTGGDTGTVYTVAVSIVTTENYQDTRRFRVKCENRFL